MFRTLALIVLVSFVGLGTSFGTAYWSAFRKNDGAEKAAPKIVQKKTRAINVPILAEGQVKGYVVAQFGYTAEEEALKSLPSAPDPLILDEAFRMIYEDDRRDFRNFRKTDLGAMAAELKSRIGARTKSDAIRDLMIEDLNYVSKDDIRK